MADTEHVEPATELNPARFVGALLAYAGGGLLTLATIAWAVGRLWFLTHLAQPPSLGEYLTAFALLIAGCSGSLLLWGLAEVIRQLDALNQTVAQNPATTAAIGIAPVAPGPAGIEGDRKALDELVTVLREVRDISLLNDQQRTLRLEIQAREQLRMLEQEVPSLLREHRWVEAERRVQAARQRFPALGGWDALQQQIDRLRASVETHDIDTAVRQVNDLVALGAWERATEVVYDLLERHPAAARAQELSRRLAAERDRAEADQRARLLAQAQEATNARDWHTALTTAQTLIQRHPRTPEALALRQQLPVLRENAEIQTRQRLESDIKELVKEQRFGAAVRVARDVLERFPSSPQAQALRQQLPRLAQKALELGQAV